MDIVGEECEVYWSAKSGRWSVGRGEVKTLVVVSSVTRSGDIWWRYFISPVGVSRQGERHG